MGNDGPKDIKRLMSHPVFLTHDTNAKIIRAQLFFFSVSTLFLVNSQVTVGDHSSILGISLQGLTQSHLLSILAILLVYQTIHFVWASWESIGEWRVRQTALGTGGWDGGGRKISAEDERDKVRQTTLYVFMVDVLESELKTVGSRIEKITEDSQQKNREELDKALNRIVETLTIDRIGDSLWRFDNWFKMFCKMQNYRWVILEFLLPLLLSFAALLSSLSYILGC